MVDRSSSHRVVIVGGGLAGLVAAHSLATPADGRRSPEIVLLEAKPRLGGAIWTSHQQGFTLEGGADSFITNKPDGVELCRELGLSGRMIGTDTGRRRSFVVREGRLVPVPEGFVLMAPSRLGPLLTSPLFSIRGKLRILMDLLIPRKAEDADESLASFVKRRLGREALDRLVQPLVGGIYTADPNELSLKATLPQFPRMEKLHGGLIRGARRQARADREASGARYGLFASLDEGMDVLTSTLASRLPPGSARVDTPVRRIVRPEAAGPWRVELLDGRALEASAVILATEAHGAARLVDGFDPQLALHMRSIPYASSVVVNIAYPRDAVSHPLDGFGAVIPTIENRSILAVSFTSAKFPQRAPAGTALFRVFVGGATQPELFDLDDAAIEAVVRRELEELLGVSGPPLLVDVGRHPRGMPQYTLGHLDRVETIRSLVANHPGLSLAGNAYSGVGIPDCIRSGRAAAANALAALVEADRKAVA